jgi:hypothetical protein
MAADDTPPMPEAVIAVSRFQADGTVTVLSWEVSASAANGMEAGMRYQFGDPVSGMVPIAALEQLETYPGFISDE